MLFRSAEGHYDRLPALAADFVTRKVDLIVAIGGAASARAAKTATSTIPIVFTTGTDAVESGLVDSLARPGGNLTGVTILNVKLIPKRIELICELVPEARTIAVLVNPNNAGTEPVIRDVPEAASTKGLQLSILKASAASMARRGLSRKAPLFCPLTCRCRLFQWRSKDFTMPGREANGSRDSCH